MSYKIKTKYDKQGVYAIICIRKMRCYVGSSQNIFKRAKNHKSLLEHGKHHVKELQADYDKGYNLEFVLLEKTSFYKECYLHLHEYTCMYKMLCDDFNLYNKLCVKGKNNLEKRLYLADTIANRFSSLYCENVHDIVDKNYHGLAGYKISYSHNKIE